MKISQLLSITENTAQEHELLSMLRASVKEIPDDIEYDFSDESVEYKKGFYFDNKSSLFNKHGRCMADETEIIDHAEQEKVLLLVGGYGFDYEEFFVCIKSPEVLIKRSTSPNRFIVTFRNKRFDLEKYELQKIISDFHNKVTDYKRIDGRSEPSDDWDEDTPSWAIRAAQRRRQRMEDDGYEPELTEDDFDFKDYELWGGFLYDNLSHD